MEKALLGLDTKRRHTHLIRAFALKMAIDMPQGHASQILRNANAEGLTGFGKIEFIANHLIRYVTTGSFTNDDRST